MRWCLHGSCLVSVQAALSMLVMWSGSTGLVKDCFMGSFCFVFDNVRLSAYCLRIKKIHNMGPSQETFILLHANNKGADQPAHPRRLISAFTIGSQ